MKKLLLNTLLLSFVVLTSNAQRVLDNLDQDGSGALYRNNVLNKQLAQKIEGSEYLVNEFRFAEISGVSKQIMIRYDAVTDMIEVQNEKKEVFSLIKNEPYSTITIIESNEKIKLLNYKSDEGYMNGYLVELFSNKDISLFRRDKITLQKGKEAVNSYQTAVPARYVRVSDEYYLSIKNKTAIPMPKNKKELQTLFPTKKEDIALYFKNNSFSLKNEKSIIEMTKFISTF
ncbi:hypothetical protein [Flavobacterium frigoris]|uniref:Uncharacterized protein n=1 Tax=Flavobacterium frigoris TaxID=229204 RepID=A0A1H9PIJ9_FLAFI|nr:hypothetical protein [Flavobacterium frigoris]SER48008.1 hypothetical protein SAMN05444355_11361 [Flavobacterium frigoris]